MTSSRDHLIKEMSLEDINNKDSINIKKDNTSLLIHKLYTVIIFESSNQYNTLFLKVKSFFHKKQNNFNKR